MSTSLSRRQICIVTVVSDDFLEYFLVFLHSILKHNPGFDNDVMVIHSETYSPLSQESRDRIAAAYSKISFRNVDEGQYAKFSPDPRFRAALLKIECFRMREYDTVIFLDSDMLCLGNLSALFALDVPFGASPAGKNAQAKEGVAGTFRRGQGFNSGVMVIGKKYLSEKVYARILKKTRSGPHADQEILNPFFRFRRIYCIDHRYNYNAAFFWKGDGTDRTDVKILHFAGEKPLQKPDSPKMKIWFAYRDELSSFA